jgi:pyruvate formate-lyase activating enzyme-like uncharacterized protein
MRGSWSCVFLNNNCTAACFFCPKEHGEQTIASTNYLDFPHLKDFLNYMEINQISGVSISGGEPLLVADQVLEWLGTIRNKFGPEIYLWLYTNGDLVDEHILLALQKAGLDEIRFNICARGYDLTPVELACRYFETVSVEIPGIPEDEEALKQALPQLVEIGVKHLNIHELFVTQENYRAFANRPYTYLEPGQAAGVIESELMILSLMKYALEKQIDLPINYCSLEYKRSSQNVSIRNRAGKFLLEDHQQMTTAGFIRQVCLPLGQPTMAALQAIPDIGHLWHVDKEDQSLVIHPLLLEREELNDVSVILQYYDSELLDSNQDEHVLEIAEKFKTVELNPTFEILTVSWPVYKVENVPTVEVLALSEGKFEEVSVSLMEQLKLYETI